MADAVISDPEFQFADKQELASLIYAHYQTFPHSPAEAHEMRSRHTPEQYRDIFDFMATATEVTIQMAAPGLPAMPQTPFQAVLNAMLSGDERERQQLYTSDFIIKPRTSQNEMVATRPDSRWVELSITVRSEHALALAKVLVDMASRPESRRGAGVLRQALLVGVSRLDTSCFTGILHFSEAGKDHALAQEKIVHEMLLRETGATLSSLYATCPPGWDSPEPGHGIAYFERSSTCFPNLDSARLISHILADAISEAQRYNIDVPDTISEHWGMNGYTGASMAPLPAHMLPHRRSHSASAIFRSQLSPALVRALQEPGFKQLLEMTQRIAKDPGCSSGEPRDITGTVYQYYTNFPHSPAKANSIRSSQDPKQLAEKIGALDALSISYAGTVDIYMQGIGHDERLRPAKALDKLYGTDGYDTALKKVCNANLIIARAGARIPVGQNAAHSVLSISVKEQHALALAEVLTEIFSTQSIANTRIDGMLYAEFSKIVSLSTRAETAAIHFVKPDFDQMAELAERIDQELMERMPRQGAEAISASDLYGEFPPPSLLIRRGMIYWEIPPNTGRVPSMMLAMSNAIIDNKRTQKDLTTGLYQRLEEKKHLPTHPQFVLLEDDQAPPARVRDCIRKLRSRTTEDMAGMQLAPEGRSREYVELPAPEIRIRSELSADKIPMGPQELRANEIPTRPSELPGD